MDCRTVIYDLGFSCTTHGDTLIVTTPLRLAGGGDVPLFIREMGSVVHLTDDGAIVYDMIVSGIDMNDGRRVASLRKALETYEVSLRDDGTAEILAKPDELPAAFARFSQATHAAAAWQFESFRRRAVADLKVAVADLLSRWRRAPVTTDPPPIKGRRGQLIKFDLFQEGEYIDCIALHQSATAHEARRLLDLRNLPANADTQIRVILDDREIAVTSNATVESESDILSSLATAMPFSALERAATRVVLQ